MIPFNIDESWYQTHWYGDPAQQPRPPRGKTRNRAAIGRIAAAALLTTIGSGAALAQGAPPGSAPWQSSWPSYVEQHQMQTMAASRATTTRPGGNAVAARRGGSVPVAGNAQIRFPRG